MIDNGVTIVHADRRTGWSSIGNIPGVSRNLEQKKTHLKTKCIQMKRESTTKPSKWNMQTLNLVTKRGCKGTTSPSQRMLLGGILLLLKRFCTEFYNLFNNEKFKTFHADTYQLNHFHSIQLYRR